ncbi:MAG: hypothetical protein ACP6IY_09055 [Promethearchaeia archaeon]
MGQSYYGIIVSTISAISLLKLAFDIDLLLIIVMFPVLLFGAYIIGYYLDVKNIMTMDQLKANEVQQRFLNTANIKTQEFELIMTQVLLEAIQALKEKKPFDPSLLYKKYEEYKKKWSYQNK